MEWLKHLTIYNDGHNILVNDWCQGKRYRTDNGDLIYEENYLNDKQHGTQYYWNGNGRLAAELNYANGKHHGIQRHWHRNGQLEDEEHYAYGLRHLSRLAY
jgi:antitoxin component YwqK of YwqJK toxin-antitoxin module